MTTHFRYVPTSGPIDGASFISQTEIAINELGGDIDTVKATADTALNTANSALATAGEALVTGQEALTAAQKAQTTADTARTEAATAQSTGDNAQARADDAYDLAATGVSDAGGAQTAADAAQVTADQALIEAKSAQSTADQAVIMGESAQQAAHLAMGVYTTMNEPVDADEEFDSARKWIVTNTESTGFPLPAPLYLTVVVAEDGSTATQTVWSLDGGPTFSRTASITLAPPVEEGEVQEDDAVIWSEWFETAGKKSLDANHALAEKAENDAATAQAVGNKALGAYETDDTAVDADTLYAEADKRYLTSANITNFPIPAPFYLDVMVNSDSTSVCQKVWSSNDAAPMVTYIRLGTVTKDDETFELSVTWGGWEQTGGGVGGEAEYTTVTDPIDANTLFSEPSKIYSSNLERTNFPPGLDTSVFLETNTNSTNTASFQRVWSADIPFWDKNVYHRTAVRNGSDAVWGPWLSTARAADVFVDVGSGPINANQYYDFPIKLMITDGTQATNFPPIISTASPKTPFFFESYTCSNFINQFQRLTQSYPNGARDPNDAPPLTYTRSYVSVTTAGGYPEYAWGSWKSNAERQRVVFVDRKPLGTTGGDAPVGGFIRTLNHILYNTLSSGVSITNNSVVSIPPGVYSVRAWVPAFNTGGCALVLRNGAGDVIATSVLTGYSRQTDNFSPAATSAYIDADGIVVPGPENQTFYLFQYASGTQPSNGLGLAARWSFLGYEYYSRLEFTRVA